MENGEEWRWSRWIPTGRTPGNRILVGGGCLCSWEFERKMLRFVSVEWRWWSAGSFNPWSSSGQRKSMLVNSSIHLVNGSRCLVNKTRIGCQAAHGLCRGHAGRADHAIMRLVFVAWWSLVAHIGRATMCGSHNLLLPVLDFSPFSSVSSLFFALEGAKHLKTLECI